MSEEIRLDGLGLAPGVLETIVTLAAEEIDGVSLSGAGLAGLVAKGKGKSKGKAKGRGVEVSFEEESLKAAVHLQVRYGVPLHTVAGEVQRAVAEALESQVGKPVAAVDVFVDGVIFQE